MLDKETVLNRIRSNRAALNQFGVKRLALFGSVVHGKQKAGSDLDFLVELECNTFDAYMGLKEYLEQLFGCQVDLVLFSTLKPRLKSRIMQDLVDAA